jgi:hypothetical protein
LKNGTGLIEKLVGEAKQMKALEYQHELLVDRINQLSVGVRWLRNHDAFLNRQIKLFPLHAAELREHQRALQERTRHNTRLRNVTVRDARSVKSRIAAAHGRIMKITFRLEKQLRRANLFGR